MSKATFKKTIRAKVDNFIDRVFLPAHVISRAGYTRFVRGLIVTEAWLSKGLTARIVEWFPLRMLRSRGTLFEEGDFSSVPRGTFPASAEVERWLCSW